MSRSRIMYRSIQESFVRTMYFLDRQWYLQMSSIPEAQLIRKDSYLTTIVEKGASIGANSTIVCGNKIGTYAFIGAGAVVTKDVKPYALVVGNPARQTGWMSEYGHKLIFDDTGVASCPESGERYKIENGNVSKIYLVFLCHFIAYRND